MTCHSEGAVVVRELARAGEHERRQQRRSHSPALALGPAQAGTSANERSESEP